MKKPFKILIVCLSKNRAKKFGTLTYDWLKHTQFPFCIFVEPQDFETYKSEGYENLIRLDQNDKGMKYAKIKARDFAKKEGYTHIFKIDDDISSWRNPANRGLGKNAPRQSKEWRTANLFDPIIFHSQKIFEDEELQNIKAVSFMYGHDMREFTGKTWTHLNKRLQSNYLIDINYFVSNEEQNFFNFEDFETFFDLIDKGCNTIQYGLTGADCDIGVLDGGCQDFDRQKMTIEHMLFLKKKYPFVPWKKSDGKFAWQPDLKNSEIKAIKL